MQKDQSYHEAAILYNEGLAEYAEKLAPTLPHAEVQRWCTAVGKQHRFHAKRHKAALEKILSKQASEVNVENISDGLDVPAPIDEAMFPDGCVDSHKPLNNPKCDFAPERVAFSG